MANRFIYKHRRGTTEQWATSDSIIYDGEIVVEKSNDGYIHLKVGDGTKKFSELPYMNIPMDSFPKELLKITVTSSDSTYSADKTDSDIKSCLDNGGIPYIALYDTVFIYEGYSSDIGYMFIDTNDGKTLCIYNNSVSLYSSNLKSKLDSTVSTTAQSLTEEQKAQARANIGAGTPYTLPQASSDALGGIKADAAETADTQPVRIGGDGKLYTAPGSGGADISLGISGATAGQMAKVKAVDESGAPTEWEAGDDTLPLLYHGKVSEAISGIEITEIDANPMSLSEVKVRAVFKVSTASWCGIELCTSAKNPDNKLITAEGGSVYTTAEKYYLVAAHGKISNGNFEINAVQPTQFTPYLNTSSGIKNVAPIKSIPNFVYNGPPVLQEMNAENGQINKVKIFGNFSEVEVIIWGR